MNDKWKWTKWAAAAILAVIAAVGCDTLRGSKPIMPIKEYEKMIVGRLDADYIGTDRCLEKCHVHDKTRKDFDLSTMGAQMSPKSGMPLVDCESCHGPGSLAVELITPQRVKADETAGKKTACDYKTFIDIKNLPAQARSLICLKCHSANATFNLHNWNASRHSIADVSCPDCHNVHMGHNLKVKLRDAAELCYKCHQEVKAEFSLPNHHPVPEKKLSCSDCHDTHEGSGEKNMRMETVKATCTQCHAEKEGPFAFEHADTMEDCRACHSSHGSVNNNLLSLREPFLCLQCHATHIITSATTAEQKRAVYTRCTDCHSQIHGTDLPSPSGRGNFIQ